MPFLVNAKCLVVWVLVLACCGLVLVLVPGGSFGWRDRLCPGVCLGHGWFCLAMICDGPFWRVVVSLVGGAAGLPVWGVRGFAVFASTESLILAQDERWRRA